MKRIYPTHTYGAGPRHSCWWDETCAAPEWPSIDENKQVDVAIIGAGFTGLSAALHLAEAGVSVAVMDAQHPGWGASGRNGGFCCLGGSKLSHKELVSRFGTEHAREFHQAEMDSVQLVAGLLDRLGIDADTHSHGETVLAHRAKDMHDLQKQAQFIRDEYKVEPTLIEKTKLRQSGMGGPFFGALTNPIGFALNPLKYLTGLAKAAAQAGAQIYANSPVAKLQPSSGGWCLNINGHEIRAENVLIATNGYSSDDLPDWLASRYLPTQSNVIVTRPLSDEELNNQGWTSHQMCYDTRNLLHYFRLLPDRRFLFGMRGGFQSSPSADRRSAQRNRRDFETMFPAWAHVETPNSWSGMVCVSRNLTPYIGPVPNMPGVFAGLAFHGNGVAMGSYTGKMLAELVQGHGVVPHVMQKPMATFPFGRARRAVMLPMYATYTLADL
ncbi:Gamma-glutamylputrescine oxidoreductase (plasmid) [Pseudoseohaeicola sp. NH-UV-7]|uniref:NAD(P)/FAD-dependent oxidoreductase n=1 Tax=Sulfitobacter sp. TBRI5 TaxID=2989732 RepID=UPI003A7A4325